MHQCEKELLFQAVTEKVPKFNRAVFDSSDNSSKQEIGTVNEILGPYNKYVGFENVRCGSRLFQQRLAK